jgi:hypothetical protein
MRRILKIPNSILGLCDKCQAIFPKGSTNLPKEQIEMGICDCCFLINKKKLLKKSQNNV